MSLKPINYGLYAKEYRKQLGYDDDIVALFYKGTNIYTGYFEELTNSWVEESYFCDNMIDLIYDVTDDLASGYFEDNVTDEDNRLEWPTIRRNLTWDEETKSFKFGNWELIVLDL